MSRHDQSSEPATRPAGLRAKLRGILIPFTTPFDAEGGVDVRAVRANVGRWTATGVSGYVALGSTGERAHLDEDERLTVVEAAREASSPESAYVVGVGAHSTRGTIREAAAAARAGADAVLVITPHFYRASMTQEVLLTHYRAVADASPVPLILYNIPQNTGVALAPETVALLSEHDNVAGIKDSSGDVVNFAEMLRQAGVRADVQGRADLQEHGREDMQEHGRADMQEHGRADMQGHGRGREFVLMTGHAGVLYPALAAGAGGAVLAVACVVPELCVEAYRAFRAGDHTRARALGERLLPVARAVTTRYGIGGLKFALDLRGYAGGPVRAPLRMPDAEARSEIARLLEEAADFDKAVNRES